MFYRIVVTALVAGVGAGLLVAVLHYFFSTPLILAAEAVEFGAPGAAGWARIGMTVLASVLTAIGFGLVLTGAMVLRGQKIDARTGALWGIAGFASLALAPAFGLAPELPGTSAAPLGDRQIWWLATVAATAVGLGVLAFAFSRTIKFAALVLIAAPHIYGAPQPDSHESLVSAGLANQFVVVSLVLNAVLWVVLGL
ncbi:MAG: CbtA family protein, partial [Alphaproteobacteria bacterium]